MTQHRAVIGLKSKSMTLSTDEVIPSETNPEHNAALRVLDDEVNVPPRSSVTMPVCSGSSENYQGIIEGSTQLLFDRGLGVVRGIARLRNGKVDVIGTNFSEEYRHFNKGTMIAFLDELADIRYIAALSDRPADDSPKQDTLHTFDISQSLPLTRQDQIRSLLQRYSKCFSSSSKHRQTPIAKHRILTDEHTRPLRQSPQHVSPRERQDIRDQVEEMLCDDIIQPSNSPWAAPVVLVEKIDGTLRLCVEYRLLNNIVTW